MKMLRYVSPLLLLSTNLFAGEVKMGGLFRGELMYNTNKTAETAGSPSGSKTATTQQAYLNLTANGSLSDNVKFESEVQFIGTGGGLSVNCMNSPVRTAKATWWHQDTFSVAMGCSKAKSGGWDFAMYNPAQSIRPFNPANSTNGGNSSFSYVPNIMAFNPSIEVGVHMFGDLTLQIMNDVMNVATGWNTKATQTWNLEWKGELAGIQPILQYGMYDAGHSYHFDVGLMLDVANVGIKADYMMVGNSEKAKKTGSDGSESKMDAANRFSAEVSYNVNGMMPSLYYSNYMNKPKVKDPKANSAPGTWDHDGQVLGVALAVNSLSSNFAPYIAYDWQSGKFAVAKETKTNSDSIIRIGATAHF